MQEDKKIDISRTKLFELHATYGARFIEFADYLVPLAYGNGTIKETIFTRESCSFFDVSHMGQIDLIGKNASQEIEKLIPSNITSIDTNKSIYSMILNDNGGIIDDLIITKKNDRISLVVNASRKGKILGILASEISSEVSIEHNAENSLISIQGPKAYQILEPYFQDINNLKFMNGYESFFNKSKIFISRSGYTGEDGFEISLPNSIVEDLVESLLEDSRISLAGFGARDVLRIEAGLCLYGQDISESITPLEAGLNWVISKKKLDDLSFLGSTKLKSKKEKGLDLFRVGISLKNKVIPRNSSNIKNKDNKKIGFVTSGSYSPNISKPICMGYISQSELKNKSDLNIEVRGEDYSASFESLPFISHKYKK